MKTIKKILLLGTAIASTSAVSASVTITLPEGTTATTIKAAHVPLSEYINSGNRAAFVEEELSVNGNKIVFEEPTDAPSIYLLGITPSAPVNIFTIPGENLAINITSFEPIEYSVTGSPLMEGIQYIDSQLTPVYTELRGLDSASPDYQANIQNLITKYNNILIDYITANPSSQASAYALTLLDGEDFFKGYEKLNDEGKKSVLFPMVSKKLEKEEYAAKMQRLQAELSSGEKTAPEIALPDLDGKIVKLSDFKGKWVIVDFWGSWCGWCIKGFPKLKEVYEANKDRLIVFGVDNGDSPEGWRAAVEKYALPWVNVYNAGSEDRTSNDILAEYGVQGFPTKAIINPEGKVVNITTGEDPNFYTILENLMK